MINRRIVRPTGGSTPQRKPVGTARTAPGGDSYYAPSPEALQQKLKALETKQRSGEFWTPKEGKNTIRILPANEPTGLFYAEAVTHFSVGPGKKTVTCLADEDSGCPVCELITKFANSESDQQKAKAKEMGARTRIVANIIDRDTGNNAVWAFGEQVLLKLLGFFADPEWGDFTHPEKGFDVIIQRTGTGARDTKYDVRLSRNATPIGVKGWSQKMSKLKDIYKKKSRADILSIIRGEEPEK